MKQVKCKFCDVIYDSGLGVSHTCYGEVHGSVVVVAEKVEEIEACLCYQSQSGTGSPLCEKHKPNTLTV